MPFNPFNTQNNTLFESYFSVYLLQNQAVVQTNGFVSDFSRHKGVSPA